MANMLHYCLQVNEFTFQSRYRVHFQTNTFEETPYTFHLWVK